MALIEQKQFTMKNGEKFTVRTAFPEDAAKIFAYTKDVINEAEYLVTTIDEFKITVKDEEQFIRNMLSHEGKLALVAEYDGEIISFLDFHNGDKKRLHHQGSFGMSVARTFRGQGVGSKMIETLLSWAKDSPIIEKVCLEVFSKNTLAISLYKKFGFVEEGRKRKAIKLNEGEYDDLILMGYFVKYK